MPPRLPIDTDTLAAICRRHGIKKLSLFGSALKGTAGPESDIDLLVEFLPEARPSLFDMVQIEIDLSQGMGGRKVDVRTARDLSPYFRGDVVREAQVQYEAR
jgi:predicted nucleotidyltransferase